MPDRGTPRKRRPDLALAGRRAFIGLPFALTI
jgi:hypothetical protein